MYVLSKDNDFLDYKCDNLIITDNLSDLLENITRYYNQRFKLKRITRTRKRIKNYKSELENLSMGFIKDKVSLTSKLNISSFKIIDNKLISHKIIAFRSNRTEIECVFRTTFSFFVFEDNEFREIQPKRVNYDFDISMFIEIDNYDKIDIKPIVEDMYLVYKE